jgi:hypothetical protein
VVTQAARDAAATQLPDVFWQRIVTGQKDDHPLVQLLARFEARAKAEGIEMAARIADKIADPANNWGCITELEADAARDAAKAIAAAIRALDVRAA